MEKPIWEDDVGVPLFQETSIFLFLRMNAEAFIDSKMFQDLWATHSMSQKSPDLWDSKAILNG